MSKVRHEASSGTWYNLSSTSTSIVFTGVGFSSKTFSSEGAMTRRYRLVAPSDRVLNGGQLSSNRCCMSGECGVEWPNLDGVVGWTILLDGKFLENCVLCGGG